MQFYQAAAEEQSPSVSSSVSFCFVVTALAIIHRCKSIKLSGKVSSAIHHNPVVPPHVYRLLHRTKLRVFIAVYGYYLTHYLDFVSPSSWLQSTCGKLSRLNRSWNKAQRPEMKRWDPFHGISFAATPSLYALVTRLFCMFPSLSIVIMCNGQNVNTKHTSL